jgi:preprotein translocase YajC subunit
MNFLLATTDATQWILPAVLLALVIGIFILNYFRSKKTREGVKSMVDSLKVGDNVKTYSGLYGRIVEIIETTDGKVAVLETGSDKNKGIFSIDINAIYGIDAKQPVTYDANGNIIDPAAPINVQPVNETKTELKETNKETTEQQLDPSLGEQQSFEIKDVIKQETKSSAEKSTKPKTKTKKS